MIAASAPLRIDLTGGYTDIRAIYQYLGGVALNLAISHRTFVSPAVPGQHQPGRPVQQYRASASSEVFAERLLFHAIGLLGRDGPQRVSVRSEGPRGCGLGSSASLAVAVTALAAPDLPRSELVEVAREAEVAAGNECGLQDELAAVYGGVNAVVFPSTAYVPPTTDIALVRSVERYCSLWVQPAPRSSGALVERILARLEMGDRATHAALRRLNGVYSMLRDALLQGRAGDLVQGVREVHAAQIALHQGIVPVPVQRLVAIIEERFGGAAKLQGGGGAGAALLVLAPDDAAADLYPVMAANGYRNLRLTFEDRGVVLHGPTPVQIGASDDYLRT